MRAELKNPFQQLKSRDIFLLTLLLVVIAGLLWYFFMYAARRAEIEAARSRLETLQVQVQASRAANAELPALRQEVAALETQREVLLRALPPTTRFGEVLGEIRSDVLASGAELNAITQSGGAQNQTLPAGVRPVNISLTVDGTFSQLYGVLRSLEGMSRFSTINALSLNLGQATSFNPTLGGQVGVTVYTFDPNAATAAPATPDSTSPNAPTAPPAGGNP